MKPKLIISSDSEETKEIVFEDRRDHIVGRDQNADICLPERRISRKHAIIRWREQDDHLEIEDLGSLNGTHVNGSPIKKLSRLRHGDHVRIGGFHLLVDYPNQHVSGIDFSSSLVELEPLKTNPDSYQTASGPQSAHDTFDRLSSIEPLEETGGRLISGRLQELSLPDLLQMLATTRKTGILAVSPEKILRLPQSHERPDVDQIFIRDGEVLNAISGKKTGEDAFFQALEREEGFFALFPLSPDQSVESNIQLPLEMLLIEGIRKIDEKKADSFSLQPEDRVEPNPDEALTQLTPEELKVFQLAWKYQKISEIIAHASGSPLEVEEVLKRLLRNAFLKKL